jgi:hypothetical protein
MERNNDNNSRIPENDPSKAMDSKEEVARSNDEKTDQDFPGYPHYPAKEDIMDGRTGAERVEADVENLPSGRNATGVNQRFVTAQEAQKTGNADQDREGEDLDIHMGTDADVNDDDLATLNSTNAEIGTPQNVSNEDLEEGIEIPGTELDDEAEDIGAEDEENNYYSLNDSSLEDTDENA